MARRPSKPKKPLKAVGKPRKPARAPQRPSKGRRTAKATPGPLARPKRSTTVTGAPRRRSKGPKAPLWTLEHGVTYSSLSLWESCAEQFGLKYVDGWTAKSLSIPLEFGSLFHLCQEHQFSFPNPMECARVISQQYFKWREPTLLNNSELDDLKFLVGLCEVTFPAYCKYWAADDKAVEWIGRETKFKVPYTLSMSGKSGGSLDNREVILNGMRDGVFRSKGVLGVFETKTKSRISDKEITTGLRADMQTLFYTFVTWVETGEMPKLVKYNIVRRADGRSPHRPKGVSTIDYLKIVEQDVASRPDYYFSRFKVDMLEADIVSFKNLTLDPLLRRFIVWADGVKKNPLGQGRYEYPYHSRNLSDLTTKYGVADVWEIVVNDNYRNHYIRSEVFPELADSFLVIP